MVNNVDLLSPFPQELVRKAPAGKFGDYVPHAHYVERLRDSGINYKWECEPVYSTHNGEKRIVGAKGIITLDVTSEDATIQINQKDTSNDS